MNNTVSQCFLVETKTSAVNANESQTGEPRDGINRVTTIEVHTPKLVELARFGAEVP